MHCLLSTTYFGPIQWYQKLNRFDCLIDGCEPFIKQTYRNRCIIATTQGTQTLTVPIDHSLPIDHSPLTIDHSSDAPANVQCSMFNVQYSKDFRTAINPKHPQSDPDFVPKPYYQVYQQKHGFIPNLSILDLLFNMGNEAILYL